MVHCHSSAVDTGAKQHCLLERLHRLHYHCQKKTALIPPTENVFHVLSFTTLNPLAFTRLQRGTFYA